MKGVVFVADCLRGDFFTKKCFPLNYDECTVKTTNWDSVHGYTGPAMTDVRKEFERCIPWIEDALSYGMGTHTVEDVWYEIVNGDLQFWPAERGCFVTEVQVHPQCRIFHVFLAGGEMDQLKEMIDSLESFAEALGCKFISISGRKGWERALKDRGVRPLSVVVGKELQV